MPSDPPVLRSLVDAPLVQAARREAEARGMEASLVGGAVRDALLGRPVKDLDLVLAPRPGAPAAPQVMDLGRALADRMGGSYVPLDPERGIARVVLRDGGSLDLALRVGSSLEEDLRARDFTLNAMALDLATGMLVDPAGGAADLAARRLREAGPTSLPADPLRCLRALRFLCQLGFRPAEGLEEALARHAPLLARVSGERIRDELFASLRAGLAPFLDLAVRSGVLGQVLPEIGEPPGRDATLGLLGRLERLAADRFHALGPAGPLLDERLQAPLAGERRALDLLKLAALLSGGRDSGRAREVALRLALSRREEVRLARVLGLLERALALGSGDPGPRERHRLFREAGEAAPDLLALAAADRDEVRKFVIAMSMEFFQEGRLVRPKVPLTGADLTSLFGLPPGPRIGRILERLAEAVAAGEVCTREDAADRVAEWLTRGAG